MVGGCFKTVITFVVSAIGTFGAILAIVVILGKCAGPLPPDQQPIVIFND